MENKNKLPRFYLITPDYDGNMEDYLTNLELSLKHGIRLMQLRSKNLSEKEYLALAKTIVPLVHSYHAKVILNGSIELLANIPTADGIHLPSNEYINLKNRPIDNDHLLSVACHNKEQITQAEFINADLAVLCPVFATPSSPMGMPIGWDNFSKFTSGVSLPIYALGGLGIEDYETAKKNGAYGLAAKRSFWGLKASLPVE